MIAVPISKTRFRCVVAFVVAWGVANTGASAATSMTQSNGLQLEMSIVGAATWTDVEVVCRITNISAVVVQFSIVTRAAGFVPELLFREGTNVPMTSGFRKLITDFDGSFKLAACRT